jgi:methionine aminotransferase
LEKAARRFRMQELFIHDKLPHVGTTIFTRMSALAAQYKAINLGQGFPDFPMDEQLVELVCKAMRDGHNQYAHMNGLPALRESIAEKVAACYKANINPDSQITVTPGGTYAIFTALTAIIQPGDEVILFEPAYDSYLPNIEINGGIAIPVALSYPSYEINWQEVREKITTRTKAIIINSPHNPTGKVLQDEDIEALRNIVTGTGVFIISDEVYEHLIFDGQTHRSMVCYPDLLERSFVCFSFGKTYHCTGWKIGYCIAPAKLMGYFRKVHQFNCFTCNSPVQVALAEFLKHPDSYSSLGGFLQGKRDYFQMLMQQTAFKPLPSSGSYFQLYSFEGMSESSEADYAEALTREAGVASIPVSAFYRDGTDHKVLRFCFAKKESTLAAAVERLKAYGI